MQVADAEVAQVVDAPAHAVEVAGEAVGVAGVAEHARLLEPVRAQQAALVEPVQLGRADAVGRDGALDEPQRQRRDVVIGVEHRERSDEVVAPALEPQLDGLAVGVVETCQQRGHRLRRRSHVMGALAHGPIEQHRAPGRQWRARSCAASTAGHSNGLGSPAPTRVTTGWPSE